MKLEYVPIDQVKAFETLVLFHDGKTITGPYDKVLTDPIKQYCLRRIETRQFKGNVGDFLSIDAPEHTPSQILILGIQDDSVAPAIRWRRCGGVLGRHLFTHGPDSFVCLTDTYVDSFCLSAFIEGVLLSQYVFDKYITEKKPHIPAETIAFTHPQVRSIDIGQLETLTQAVFLARDLINEPASVVTPEYFASVARDIAQSHGLECTVYDEVDLENMGAGAFLAVARGSQNPPRMIHLTYHHTDAPKTIALAGKGITFDSGGLSLKPTRYMLDMKGDMTGAAVVLATMKAVGQLRPRVNVHAVLCCAENMPSGKASRPGDIVQAMNGKTIEITNTDAEGRLVLADGLVYLRKTNPDVIIDVATLTGACVVALGTKIAGYFASDDAIAELFESCARRTGEAFWRLPLEKTYRELLKTSVADIKNSANDSEAGAIQGGLFLAEFVENTPWIHCDVAGPFLLNKPYYEWPEGGTGFGVRTLYEFIQTNEHAPQ